MRLLRTAAKVPRWAGYAWPHLRRALREPRYGVAVVQAGWSLWRQGGWRAVELGIATSRPAINDYGAWIRLYDTLSRADVRAIRGRIAGLPAACLPTIVIPVPETTPGEIEGLRRTIRSLQRQVETRWQAVVAVATVPPTQPAASPEFGPNDTRIRVVEVTCTGRAELLNAALNSVTASAFAVIDPGDELAPHAVYRLAEERHAHPRAAVVYSDEDRLVPARGIPLRPRRAEPCFKPVWSPEHILAAGGVGRVACLDSELVRRAGGYSLSAGTATELDLLLRIAGTAHVRSLRHIPEVLVHTANGRTPLDDPAAAAVAAHLQRLGRDADVTIDHLSDSVRVRYRLADPPPSVSLVMPTRNALDLLRQTVESLFTHADYPHLELIVVDNGSDSPDALAFLGALGQTARAQIVRQPGPFNFAALVNAGVAAAGAELVALVNNDLVAVTPDWLSELVGVATQPGVGAAGPRLWYPDGTLQHGGIVVGLGGVAGHAHKGLPAGAAGHCGRALRRHEVSAVTGACLVMRRQLFVELGGLDADHLAVAFNDVDLCLRIQSAGLSVVWTPYAELVHLESATRGAEDTPDKVARFEAEIAFMKVRWGARLAEDPYYSPNLTLDREDFSLAWPPRTVRSWHANWPPAAAAEEG